VSDRSDRGEDAASTAASRRQLLRGAVAIAGAGPTALLAAVPSAAAGDAAATAPAWTRTPLADGHGIVTPSELHFTRHRGDIPTIDPTRHELIVHGMVRRPRTFTIAELGRFPSVTRFHFIECASNGRTAGARTVQATHGLTSTAEWTGVPLSAVLRAVGVRAGAGWVVAEGGDAAGMVASVPLGQAWRDALLAYGQNGAALRPAQGFPLRLILPGRPGSSHVKWLRRLEVSDRPRGIASGGLIAAKSVITFPSGGMLLPGPGWYELGGLAWSGRGRIERVEVSSDGGRSWVRAALQEPVLPVCHTRFRLPWRWDGGATVLQSRCCDETGHAQRHAIQSWRVAQDGSISNLDGASEDAQKRGAASGSSARRT
jgi:sulfane dehydrogenase subunit SoxC